MGNRDESVRSILLSDVLPDDTHILHKDMVYYTFRLAWARMIAHCWAHRDKFKPGNHIPEEDVRKLLKRFGWTHTVDLELKVRVAEDEAPYRYRPHGPEATNGWSPDGQKKMHPTIELVIPPPPDKEHQSMALADYQATGMMFPFSSC